MGLMPDAKVCFVMSTKISKKQKSQQNMKNYPACKELIYFRREDEL